MIVVVSSALPLLGCGSEAEPPAQAPPAARPDAPPAKAAGGAGSDARAEAEQVFKTRCVTCHGAQGQGDGPASKGLTPHPRNFQDGQWQASVSDDHLRNIILYGGAAVGRSPTMPGNPDLGGRPQVVDALVQYIRELPGI